MMNWTIMIKDYQYVEQITRNIFHFYCSSKYEADKYIEELNEKNFTFYVFKRVCTLGEKNRKKIYDNYKDYNDFIKEDKNGKKIDDFFRDKKWEEKLNRSLLIY